MVAQVLFFGATADIAGMRNMEIDIGYETSAATVLKDISERFPTMSSHKLKLSINQEYAIGDEIIHHGDELAIFAAVSGG